MPETAVVEEEVVVIDPAVVEAAAAEEADFESGYANAPTEKTPPAEEEKPAAEVVPEVKYRQITEDEYTALTALSTQIESLRADSTKKIDTAFGKVGGVERTLAALQTATPAGHTVEVTDDMFGDLKTEFPELGALVEKGIKNLAKGLKGTAPAAAALDPKQIETAVTSRLVALQMEALDEDRADWHEVIGAPESNTPYRQWLATQPADYQARLASTNSAAVIAKSITTFETHAAAAAAPAAEAAKKAVAEAAKKAAAEKVAATRQQRLEAAATPRGAGGHTSATVEDDFEAGFKSG